MDVSTQEQHVVLLLEDNAELLDILLRSLRRLGNFEVFGAPDGAAGLERFYEVHPHCVVVDVKMPHLDGYQFIRALRGDPETAATPVVILTAMSQDVDRLAGMISGTDIFLTKPIAPQDLVVAIRNAIATTHDERQSRMEQLANDTETGPEGD